MAECGKKYDIRQYQIIYADENFHNNIYGVKPIISYVLATEVME